MKRGAPGIGLTIVFLIAAGTMMLSSCRSTATTGARVVQELHDRLHAGQSREDVNALLRLLRVEYSFDAKTRQFTGLVRNVERNWIITRDVQVLISLDVSDQVAHIHFRDELTGP